MIDLFDQIDMVLANQEYNEEEALTLSLELQEETLKVADYLKQLKPHTMLGEFGKTGMEISADKSIYILYSHRPALVNRSCIKTDPGTLHQFRERLPDFLQSYSQRYGGLLYELAREINTLRSLGIVFVKYIETENKT